MSPRIVITAPDVTPDGFSGMGLRALGLAHALGSGHEVSVLVAGNPPEVPVAGLNLEVGHESHARALAGADLVITSNALRLRQVLRLDAPIVSDLYDPSYFEWLVLSSDERDTRKPWVKAQLRALRRAARLSTAILCANNRQRDLYLGVLLGRARWPTLLGTDEESVRRRVITIPNGIFLNEQLPSRSEARTRLGYRANDVIFLWGGGVWDWLDVETVVRAAMSASTQNPRIQLTFLGLRRGDEPDPHASVAYDFLMRLKSEGDWANLHINEKWVAPNDRLDYLAAADAAILGQRDTLETHFSFRTRLTDCLQAGLPIVSMHGDELSEEAARDGWGLTSTYGNIAAMASNFLRLADDADLRQTMANRAAEAGAARSWEAVSRPLVDALSQFEQVTSLERIERIGVLAPAAVRATFDRLRLKK